MWQMHGSDDHLEEDRPDTPDLGPCCLCEAPNATVLLLLTARSPIPGHGWGCFTCGLDSNGASAVICERCAQPYEQGEKGSIEEDLRWACRGYPGIEGRIPFDALRGEHQHVRHRHPELEQAAPLHPLPTDTPWPTHIEEGRGCLCSRCHKTIHEGTIAVRMWLRDEDWEYRYHGVCIGAEPSPWEDPYEEEDAWIP